MHPLTAKSKFASVNLYIGVTKTIEFFFMRAELKFSNASLWLRWTC